MVLSFDALPTAKIIELHVAVKTGRFHMPEEEKTALDTAIARRSLQCTGARELMQAVNRGFGYNDPQIWN